MLGLSHQWCEWISFSKVSLHFWHTMLWVTAKWCDGNRLSEIGEILYFSHWSLKIRISSCSEDVRVSLLNNKAFLTNTDSGSGFKAFFFLREIGCQFYSCREEHDRTSKQMLVRIKCKWLDRRATLQRMLLWYWLVYYLLQSLKLNKSDDSSGVLEMAVNLDYWCISCYSKSG